MEYALTVNALTKQYRHFKALDQFSMRIPKGSIYGFVGRNGAGKTTLIRLISGLQQPTSGDYMLYNISYKDKEIKKSRRRMGVIVEVPSLYLHMSAKENLKEQYRVLGLPSFQTIPELLKLVGLENTGKKKVGNFSLGMRQRLGIAVALAGDPDFLVLDEPMNGLDPQGIIEIRELILKLNRERQMTVLISSHILEEISKIATYYGFVDSGHMIKEISAEELEKSCRKCTRIEVTDSKVLACVLDRFGLEYSITDEHYVDIFAKVNITDLTFALTEENCKICSITESDESLESYYINLIGGKDDE